MWLQDAVEPVKALAMHPVRASEVSVSEQQKCPSQCPSRRSAIPPSCSRMPISTPLYLAEFPMKRGEAYLCLTQTAPPLHLLVSTLFVFFWLGTGMTDWLGK